MKRSLCLLLLQIPALILCSGVVCSQSTDVPPNEGWQTYSIGAGRGDATLSLGAQFWKDYFRVRNLVARTTLELAPGVRAHLTARRREGDWQRAPFHPDIDEAYVEGTAFYHTSSLDLAFNIKEGRVRYLRFPTPDLLSAFDQVPGISDLTGGPVSDYRGTLFTFEGAQPSGFGLHFGGIQWGFNAPSRGMNGLEWYGFFRRAIGDGWTLEGRYGALTQRPEPLGRPARRGGSVYLGKRLGEFDIGAMVEKLQNYPAYTGIMVRFRPSDITRSLGSVGFDYSRSPEGAALQYDLLHVRFNESAHPSPDDEQVGEVRAVRIRTYWQQSFQRNEYEHRLSSWGETHAPGLHVVVEEQPWHLDMEALVSPHTTPSRVWLRDRQGPAQLAQEVIYRFYRKRPGL